LTHPEPPGLRDVSRETLERLEIHDRLLRQWNPKINLVSQSTLADSWSRHFADSAQLWRLRPASASTWLDLGAGAGFPGLVIAAVAADELPSLQVTLVESDQRKAAFLRTVIHAADLPAKVIDERIESLPPQAADVLSARALARLGDLLAFASKHRKPAGICLFPKGATVHKEIAEARSHWRFDPVIHPSQTDPRAAILEIGALDRA
jgi:16S rRNA (guanine527-N7)-methyltransferase